MTIDQIISKVKFQYIITDPFPEHTEYKIIIDYVKQNKSIFDKIFGGAPKIDKPRYISIHEAYRLGQESVYERLEALK